MDVVTNPDHRMPPHVDVFEWLSKCSRENKCSVWNCGAQAEVLREDKALETALGFKPPFCAEHGAEYSAIQKKKFEEDIL